jgi:hypothetical protein
MLLDGWPTHDVTGIVCSYQHRPSREPVRANDVHVAVAIDVIHEHGARTRAWMRLGLPDGNFS